MDKPTTYVKITNPHADMPFWYNKFLDMGKPAPIYEVVQSSYKPDYWQVVDYTHEIRKSDCEVVPPLQAQPLKKFISPLLTKAGDERVLINGVPPKVDCRIVAEDNYKILLSAATNPALPEGQHLTDEQIKTLKEVERILEHENYLGCLLDLVKAFPTVFTPARTYKVGDRLAIARDVYILVPVAKIEGEQMMVGLVSDNFKRYWTNAFKVRNWCEITEQELSDQIGEPFTLLPDTTDQMI